MRRDESVVSRCFVCGAIAHDGWIEPGIGVANRGLCHGVRLFRAFFGWLLLESTVSVELAVARVSNVWLCRSFTRGGDVLEVFGIRRAFCS